MLRLINSVAPIRICDIGGWTDTWFAQYGTVFNIAVYPFIQTQLFVYPRAERAERITIYAENYGDRFAVQSREIAGSPKLEARSSEADSRARTTDGRPIQHPTALPPIPCPLPTASSSASSLSPANCPLPTASHHALLEAAFAVMQLPEDIALEVHLYADMPPGASTGTSAAVSTALIGALDALTPGRMTAHEVARTTHRIETEVLGLQCGIQDQISSAYGGISFIEMHQYPHASVSPVQIPNSIWWELERRLVLVYLGSAHVSSETHKQVIRNFESSGPTDRRLEGLRQEARRAKNALTTGDFGAFAAAMNANTDWQSQMHPEILGPAAQEVIELARQHGAIGWKLNGAGGHGGSVTLLFGAASTDKRRFAEALERTDGSRKPEAGSPTRPEARGQKSKVSPASPPSANCPPPTASSAPAPPTANCQLPPSPSPSSLPPAPCQLPTTSSARVIPLYLSRYGLRVWETGEKS